jgi:Leucine rich repeat
MAAGNNLFSGTLPYEWPDTLLYLDFGYNNLTKGIPDRICHLQRLMYMKVDNNLELNGTIPSCIFEIRSLHGLILSRSNLYGGILPTQIGLLSNLETLDGSYNTWIGTLPTELGHCTRLHSLALSNSGITGSIPSEIGQLRLLQSFDLRNNSLVGILPEQMQSLTDLQYLGLAGNEKLNGILPPNLCHKERNWSTTIDIGCHIHCSCCSRDTPSCG